ncbi:MAG: hypothetical protein WC782_07465 [Methylococcaceae bacterium]|jgi:hypothetical protein
MLRAIHPIHYFAFCLAVIYGVLAWFSRQESVLNWQLYAGLTGLAFTLYAFAYFNTDKVKQFNATTLIIWSIVFRGLGFWGEPIFEDDYFRYLWDGYHYATHGTPYGIAPAAYFSDISVTKALLPALNQINHPDLATIYGPSFQLIFLVSYWLAPGQLWPLKLLLITADLLLIFVLLRLTRPKLVLLYAWNPLVLKEIAFTAHPDGLIPALLLGSWYLARQRHYLAAGLTLAFATATKASTWLLTPFIVLSIANYSTTFIFISTYCLLYAPFLLQGATEFSSLQQFYKNFEFNSALYAITQLAFQADTAKKLLAILCLSGGLIYFRHFWRQRPSLDKLPRGDWLFGGLLLAAPVINPWYLLWLLPFACIYPSFCAWFSSAAICLAYATELNLEAIASAPYQHPYWVRPLEFALIAGAFCVDIFNSKRSHALVSA